MSYTICKKIKVFKAEDAKWYMSIFGTENNVDPYDWCEMTYPSDGCGFTTQREADAKALKFYVLGEIQGRQIYDAFLRDIEAGRYHSHSMDRLKRIRRAKDKAYELSRKLWDGTIYNDTCGGHWEAEGANWERWQKLSFMYDGYLECGKLVDDFYDWMRTKDRTPQRQTTTQLMLF